MLSSSVRNAGGEVVRLRLIGKPILMIAMKPVPNRSQKTRTRKEEHLQINLAGEFTGDVPSGFDLYHFEHLALPEIDLTEVSTATTLFGRPMRSPILVSCMTGGRRMPRGSTRSWPRRRRSMGWRWVWGRVGCCSKIPARRASISAQEPPGYRFWPISAPRS